MDDSKKQNPKFIIGLANNASYPDAVRFLFLCFAAENTRNYSDASDNSTPPRFQKLSYYRNLLIHGKNDAHGENNVSENSLDYEELNNTANKTLEWLLHFSVPETSYNKFNFNNQNFFLSTSQLLELAYKYENQIVKFVLLYTIFSTHLGIGGSQAGNERSLIVSFINNHFAELRPIINLSRFGIKKWENGKAIPLDGEINKTIVKKAVEEEQFQIRRYMFCQDLQNYNDRKNIYLNLMLRGNGELDQCEKMKALFLTIYQIRSNLFHGEKFTREDTRIRERDFNLITDSIQTLNELAGFITSL